MTNYVNVINIHEGLTEMEAVARLDDMGKPAWIGLMVLGFVLWWPAGLALLAFLLWSGRMGCGSRRRERRNGMDRAFDTASRWCNGGARRQSSSGNAAFDEYREETLRRLEEEQKEFKDFLERLRVARDKAEFDQFLAERRRQPDGPEAQPHS